MKITQRIKMQDDSPAVSYRWSITELLSNSGKAGTIIMAFTCTGASKLFRPSCLRGSLAVLHAKLFFFFPPLTHYQKATDKKKPFSHWIRIDKESVKGILQISTLIPRVPGSV